MAQSEEGMSSDIAKVAVMFAAKNQAKKIGVSLTSLLTHTSWVDRTNHSLGRKFPEADGKYSRQTFAKYASTITAPTGHTKALANEVMGGEVSDPTGGATKFDNPRTQDAMHAVNPSMHKSSTEIAAKRQAEGLTLIQLDGVSTRFWRG
jgi:hypothetical protein